MSKCTNYYGRVTGELEDFDMDDTIKVALRIRPLSGNEVGRGCQSCLTVIPHENQVQVLNTDKAFTYNNVFGPESTQSDLYENAVQHLVKQLFKGYNVTILAYGQTGSGKTYSMGTCYAGEGEMGIIPRAICEIFDLISCHKDMEFKVTTSFMELYKEQLYDLLAASNKPRDQCIVDIREDSKGIRIPGLTEMQVESALDTTKTLILGSGGRVTGATAMNAVSSRSHAIFTVTIHMCKKNNQGGDMVSKFHLVDLAGSERPKKTMATGERFKEGVNINRGLLALGNVISALGEGTQKSYIGYRDSKLTRLLQDSLGGNSMTLMIACVSPADYNLEETLSTLRYADRARHIKNKPIVNQDPKAAELARLHKEVAELRVALMANGGGLNTCPKEHETLAEEVAELNAKNRKITEALNDALAESMNLVERALLAEMARDRMSVKLTELQAQCNLTLSMMDQSIDMSSNSVPDVWKEQLAGLKSLQSKISELHAEQKRGHDEILSHQVSDGRGPQTSLKDKDSSDASEDSGELMPRTVVTPASPTTLAEFQKQEETHTLQQAELNQELRELTRALALKEELASKLAANANGISATLRHDYEENVKQLESQISQLNHEKENLMQTLKAVQENNASNKISEQRRKRLQELEQLIQNLKKKVVEQTRIIKVKEKNDEKINKLNIEIQSMKSMKVKLIRQMRQEGERFRTWKAEREKEVLQLKEKERKRINQMSKMESMHAKQQNVLKRKVEEAAAINKRLKDALALQKQTQEKRMTLQGKAERIQSWVAQELNVLVSTIDAERARDKLIEDRSILQAEMNVLQETWERAEESDREEIQRKMAQLAEDLSVRNFQIAELNQKILDSDQENKSRTRWESIQSMAEAKCALKHVFELAAEMRKDHYANSFKMEELEEEYRKTAVQLKLCEEKLREESQSHRTAVLALEEECEEKVAMLLRRLEETTPSDLQMRIDELEQDNERLRMLEEQVHELRRRLESSERGKTENVPPKLRVLNNLKTMEKQAFLSPDMFSEDDFDPVDDDKDPDWTKTPIFQRLQRMKRKTGVPDQSKLAVKRSSDGQTICDCKGVCVRCSCRSVGASCGDNCQCNPLRCKNRSKGSPPSSNGEISIVESSQESKKPRRKILREIQTDSDKQTQ